MLNHILPCHRLGSPLTTLVQLVCNVSCNVHVRVAFALTPGLITKVEVKVLKIAGAVFHFTIGSQVCSRCSCTSDVLQICITYHS